MRKITSRHKEEQKRKRNNLIVGIILVAIMFLSVLGYSFGNQESESTQKVNYNGFEFVNNNDLWITNIQEFNFVFKNNPRQVEKIYSIINEISSYANQPLYVYSEDRNSEIEIYRNLDPRNNPIVLRIQPACMKEESCSDDTLPIKTCGDNFILIKEAENTSITQKDNCVYIQGPKGSLSKITDEFLFKLLGIEQ